MTLRLLCLLGALLWPGMGWGAVTNVITPFCQGSTDTNGFTTASKNTTTATAIIVAAASYAPATDPGITDSQSNSYGSPIINITTGNVQHHVWVVASPSTSASHTLTVSGSGNYVSICVAVLAGTAAASIVDGTPTSSGSLTSTTVQPGSITPGANNYALLTFYSSADLYSTVDSPFSPADASIAGSGNHESIAIAHDFQTTATARNPTWTWGFNADKSSSMVSIKGATAAEGAKTLMLLGVGK